MSDKAVVAVAQQHLASSTPSHIYLYAYWDGSHLALAVKDAITRAPNRWKSDCLLARVIFSEMTRGMEEDTARHGICGYLTEVARPLITVDCDAETVTIKGRSPFSFSKYVKTPDQEILSLMGGCADGTDCVMCDRRRQRLERGQTSPPM